MVSGFRIFAGIKISKPISKLISFSYFALHLSEVELLACSRFSLNSYEMMQKVSHKIGVCGKQIKMIFD